VSAGSAKMSSSRGGPRCFPPLRSLCSSSCDLVDRCTGGPRLPFIPCGTSSGLGGRLAPFGQWYWPLHTVAGGLLIQGKVVLQKYS
jgi:hypothetical protein